LSNSDVIKITISDVLGSTFTIEEKGFAGLNSLSVPNIESLKPGVLFYIVQIGEEMFSGSIIKM
jgi:hypothetical protein